MTWRTFSEALWRPTNPENPPTTYDGIGFVFCSADPYVGVDLDNCRDPEVGTVAEWAQKIIESFADSYVEASPSGTGVHITSSRARSKTARRKRSRARASKPTGRTGIGKPAMMTTKTRHERRTGRTNEHNLPNQRYKADCLKKRCARSSVSRLTTKVPRGPSQSIEKTPQQRTSRA
jgi:hypothetical protein